MNGQIIPYVPTFAAVIILAIIAGRTRLNVLWQRVTHWRTPFVWFIAGPAVVLGYHALATVTNILLGAQVASLPHISTGIFLELLLLGGL